MITARRRSAVKDNHVQNDPTLRSLRDKVAPMSSILGGKDLRRTATLNKRSEYQRSLALSLVVSVSLHSKAAVPAPVQHATSYLFSE